MKTLALALVVSLMGYSGAALGDLVWQKKEVSARLNYGDPEVVSTAQFYCSTLKEDGQSGWRLPTREELVTEAQLGKPEGIYWSSTPAKSKDREAIAVDLKTGLSYARPVSSLHFVRCVRGQSTTIIADLDRN